MRLPIPFESGGRVVSEVEIEVPRAGVLADTQRAVDKGSIYTALSILVSGVITAVDGKSVDAKQIVKDMPYRSTEYVALQALLLISPDDGFEGVYDCPRCGNQLICELSADEDTRDFVSDLLMNYGERPKIFELELSKEIVFTDKGEEIDRVEAFEMRHPTMTDCIRGEARAGGQGTSQQQFAIYAQALLTINGKEINTAWRDGFGTLLFERIIVPDMLKISREMAYYGLQNHIEKVCRKCGKVWQAPVDTSNFFASALRSV